MKDIKELIRDKNFFTYKELKEIAENNKMNYFTMIYTIDQLGYTIKAGKE